jgi:hypothetical protein
MDGIILNEIITTKASSKDGKFYFVLQFRFATFINLLLLKNELTNWNNNINARKTT